MRENACEQVTIGFDLTSDWLGKWREIFYPIRERSKAKAKQAQHFFRHSIESTLIGVTGLVLVFWHSIENHSIPKQSHTKSIKISLHCHKTFCLAKQTTLTELFSFVPSSQDIEHLSSFFTEINNNNNNNNNNKTSFFLHHHTGRFHHCWP